MERFDMEVRIPKRRTLRIRDAKGGLVKVCEGCLWITQEKDTADKVLEAGDALRLERNGLALGYAFRETRLVVAISAPGAVFSLTLGGGYREYAWGVWGSVTSEMWTGVRDRLVAMGAIAARLLSRGGKAQAR
jgi:hypothetical protein